MAVVILASLLLRRCTGGEEEAPQPTSNIPSYVYDNTKFTLTDDGGVTYTDPLYTVRQGIDISSHNGDVDWEGVAQGGIEFAVIRTGWRGYTEGSLNEDTKAKYNIDSAHENGLDVGVYFYSQAITPAEAVEEAMLCLKVLDGRALELPIYYDWELPEQEHARTRDPDGDVLTECALAFCQTIENAGYEAGVYFYTSLALDTYDLEQLADYPFWLGQPGTVPDFPHEMGIWQYSCTGTVPGVSTVTDRNLMFIRNDPKPEETAGAG